MSDCPNCERLKEELQRRRDDEPHQRLRWRGIDTEFGAVVCKHCGGSGVKAYGSTTTWRAGFGGQAITSDVCDQCWGSGILNRKWANLRVMTAEIAGLKAQLKAQAASEVDESRCNCHKDSNGTLRCPVHSSRK